MKLKVVLGVSNRHVHLTKEVYDELFSEELHVKNPLKQTGEFASDKVVSVVVGDKVIDNVRIVGPLRNYNQVEVSLSDARKLKVNPPMRRSGDLVDSLPVTLKTEKGSVSLDKGLIIPNRHIHMSYDEAKKLGLEDNQELKVSIGGLKKGIIYAVTKLSEKGVIEMHIDTDDANAFMLNTDDVLEVTDEL